MIPENENHTKDIDASSAVSSPRKGKKKYFVYVLILILIPSVAFAWNFYTDIKDQQRQEELDLAVLCEENYNITDYQNFLEKYPQSPNNRKVKQRIKQLETMAAEWEQIQHSNNVNEFIHYKNKYNSGPYARLCDLRIDTLDWESAQKRNHPEAYQEYLNRHANGAFLAEAIAAQQAVAYMSMSQKEIDYIHEICNRFLTAMGINDTVTIHRLLTPEVEYFIDIPQPGQEDILKSIQRHQEQHVFMTYLLPSELNTQKGINEKNEKIYVSTFNVDQITTDSNGAETTKTCETTVKMNTDLQIYSFTIKEI